VETKSLDVFSELPNYGIVRMPGREFPGCVVQGDSLAILCRLARSIVARLDRALDVELREDADELRESLESRLRHYESVLSEHGLPLPYSRSENSN
jgi:hypothetical protein